MDTILFLKGIFLAVVCGVLEFLPVSSNGHVLILTDVLKFEGPGGKMFEMSLQLGAIMAVCWLFRAKLWHTASCMAKNAQDRRFALNLLIAFLPVAVLGLAFNKWIIAHLFNPTVVAVMLIVGGVAILVIEKIKPRPTIGSVDDITMKQALAIGLIQAIALVPGVSRSGATIMGAMLLGVERRAAAEFSFFLAIPVIVAASLYDILKHHHEADAGGHALLLVGFIISFFCAMIVVQWLMRFISRHGFVPFAWYRIVAGTATLALLFLRG